MIAEVVFNLPVEKSFHYLIPEKSQLTLKPGMRVLAPFGRRERMGFVIRLVKSSPIKELKSIRRVVDPVPVIDDERWQLASWLSDYYYCSIGETLSAMVPSNLRLRPSSDKEQGMSDPLLRKSPYHLSKSQQTAFDAITKGIQLTKPATFLPALCLRHHTSSRLNIGWLWRFLPPQSRC